MKPVRTLIECYAAVLALVSPFDEGDVARQGSHRGMLNRLPVGRRLDDTVSGAAYRTEPVRMFKVHDELFTVLVMQVLENSRSFR